ncbi:hypothetical protein Q0601_23195 [Paracoccus onubensis]|uniref:hypothetical protein n=1 Tax=Paracoccus onubensis TaxID=1675788 RepID=UPI00272EE8AC|nr:hypothetical protein [Paracoccus onubensis]MDP0930091.1 hypothetical protein [Paracoccus onubensis]
MNGDVGFMDETALRVVVRQLRGITEAKVLFVGHHPEFEDEFISILLALDISVSSDHTEELVPAPHRRFSFRFSGSTVAITVAPDVDPDHY